MKATFKPLSLAVAVATASAGYAGITNAQDLAGNTGLGDLAIVPYYSVNNDTNTGIIVINTSTNTQVVKVRMRRALDSMDALDFNVVLSPNDVWTGYLTEEAFDGSEFADIRFVTNDASCVVPDFTVANSNGRGGYFTMPEIYREGAESGYIEIMAMGQPADEAQPIAVDALHATSGATKGIPADCDRVRDNFFRGTTANDYYVSTAAALAAPVTRNRGVINSALTWQRTTDTATAAPLPNSYVDSDNVLKVSYFLKDGDTGIEFGNDAVHIEDFMLGASITNQRVGINEGDLQGFDHPDLDGGAPTSNLIDGGAGADGDIAPTGAYAFLREALGAAFVINDWSKNTSEDGTAFTVDTDWVITTPGQYLMTNQGGFIDSLEEGGAPCLASLTPGIDNYDPVTGANCDFRDIPLTVSAQAWDREEFERDVPEDDLVVSPTPPIPPNVPGTFQQEVNVIQWGNEPVLYDEVSVEGVVPVGAESGWARVAVTATTAKTQAICTYTDYGVLPLPMTCSSVDIGPIPLVGFVAWQRNFGATPDRNYGRIVEHSFNRVAP
jgi:hypothetical protein